MKKYRLNINSLKWLFLIITVSMFLYNCSGKKEEAGYEEFKGEQGELSHNDILIQELKAKLYENPQNFELLSALGDEYFNQTKFYDAIREYEKALKIKPDSADCLNDLGLAYFYTGNSDKALDSVNKSIEVDAEYKYSWLSKGYMLTSLGRYDEAVPALKMVKKLDPGGPLAQEADKFLQRINLARSRNNG